jgi:predicted acylesterase/phospholipase RssA
MVWEGHMNSKIKSNPAELRLALSIMLILLLGLVGCSVKMNTLRRHVRGYPIRADRQAHRLKPAAAENSKAMDWFKENEWPFNKGDKTQPPKQCLALSGGGIRSAAFGIGVLKGLHEKGILDRIDIISGVSGGSFALSWYYFQQYSERLNAKDMIFANECQDELLERSRFYSNPDMAVSVLGNILLSPVNLILNHVFSFNVDTTLSRSCYEQAIKNTFNAGKDSSFLEMFDFIKNNGLPYFIINASAAIDYSPSYHGSKLANRVFEFTPLRFGSDGFGYSNEFPVTVGRAISISGAAVDLASNTPGRLESTFLSALNIDLGYHIRNYNNEDNGGDLKRFIPLYSLINPHDINGTDILLVDGGFVENLGVYSLVRRLCQEIIVVDATYDPDYRFDEYFKLKSGLRSEMQVELEIENIDRLAPEFESGVLDKSSSSSITSEPLENSNPYDTITNYDGSNPVMKGSISYFPIESEDGTIEQREIDVTYIKLSINDKLFNGFSTDDPTAADYSNVCEYYGENVVEYYLQNKMNNKCGELLFDCQFPQYTTMDQSYTPEQFKAYVDLGYYIVKNET